MNPIPEEPKTPLTGDTKPTLDPKTYVPEDSSPQTDSAALDAIGALEAEEDTIRPIQPTQSSQAVTPAPEQLVVVDVMTPFVPEQPTVVAEDVVTPETPESTTSDSETVFPVLPINPAGTLQDSPTQTNSNPFPEQKKSTKRLVIVLIAVAVLIGAAVAGYFMWQAAQSNSSDDGLQNNSSQSGAPLAPTPTDTESNVNASATSLEQGVDSIDDSAYDDSTLSDEALYDN